MHTYMLTVTQPYRDPVPDVPPAEQYHNANLQDQADHPCIKISMAKNSQSVVGCPFELLFGLAAWLLCLEHREAVAGVYSAVFV
jgi:hypothetical protein